MMKAAGIEGDAGVEPGSQCRIEWYVKVDAETIHELRRRAGCRVDIIELPEVIVARMMIDFQDCRLTGDQAGHPFKPR